MFRFESCVLPKEKDETVDIVSDSYSQAFDVRVFAENHHGFWSRVRFGETDIHHHVGRGCEILPLE